jgi:hypothetical protein
VLIAMGVVCLLCGLLLGLLGAAVASVLGPDNAVSTAPARLHGRGVALVVEDITVDSSNVPLPSGLGTLTLTVTAPDHRGMFVGTAAPKALDTYLAGAPYDVVVDLTSGSTGTTRPVPGTQQPRPPGAQPFWIAKSNGSKASIAATVSPSTSVVVMNADASPAVTADVVVSLGVAHAWTWSLVSIGAGALLIVIAITLFVRSRSVRRAAPATGTQHASTAGATVLPSSDRAAPVESDVPAWAVAGGPDTLTGEEAASPPLGTTATTLDAEQLVSGGLADRISVSSGPSGPSGDSEPETAHDEGVAARSDAVPTDAGPIDPVATHVDVDTTAPQRADDPVYEDLQSWFRDSSPP